MIASTSLALNAAMNWFSSALMSDWASALAAGQSERTATLAQIATARRLAIRNVMTCTPGLGFGLQRNFRARVASYRTLVHHPEASHERLPAMALGVTLKASYCEEDSDAARYSPAPYRTEGERRRDPPSGNPGRRSRLRRCLGQRAHHRAKRPGVPALGDLLGPGADPDLCGRLYQPGPARHQPPGPPDAPPAAAREGIGDVAEFVGRTAHPRGRGWLDGRRVCGIGRAVPRARPPHGRGYPDDARSVVRGPGQLRGAHDPGRDRGHAHAAKAGEADPDLDRRHLRAGLGARDAARRLARLALYAGAGRADRRAAARPAPRA